MEYLGVCIVVIAATIIIAAIIIIHTKLDDLNDTLKEIIILLREMRDE